MPPHIQALEALEELKKEKLWQSGKVKEYHSILTEIVRIYIEDRFHIPAIELTTNEILHSFQKVMIDAQLKDKLKYILELADLVKFAKAQPLPDEHAECLDRAVEFVRNTIPIAQTPEKETESGGSDEKILKAELNEKKE